MHNAPKLQNAFSVDVEEWFHAHALAGAISPGMWNSLPSRVEENTLRMLDILQQNGVQATFFILGWVAERYPSLMRRIQANGHEIATHGCSHHLIYEQTPQEFYEDLKRSIDILQDTTGARVYGYRAPSFSVIDKTLWALDIIKELGLVYDSSIFPLPFHDLYGMHGSPRHPYKLPNGLWEFPVATIRLGRWNLPVGGGGYFRFLPLGITTRALSFINQREGMPVVFYTHPWEIDKNPPNVNGASFISRFRAFANTKKTEERLCLLLKEFSFSPLFNLFQQYSTRNEK